MKRKVLLFSLIVLAVAFGIPAQPVTFKVVGIQDEDSLTALDVGRHEAQRI